MLVLLALFPERYYCCFSQVWMPSATFPVAESPGPHRASQAASVPAHSLSAAGLHGQRRCSRRRPGPTAALARLRVFGAPLFWGRLTVVPQMCSYRTTTLLPSAAARHAARYRGQHVRLSYFKVCCGINKMTGTMKGTT